MDNNIDKFTHSGLDNISYGSLSDIFDCIYESQQDAALDTVADMARSATTYNGLIPNPDEDVPQ